MRVRRPHYELKWEMSVKMDRGRKIRVLMSKIGLDGHDKGAIVVSVALRDAGMEVIYLGLRRSVDEVVKTAIEEDIDVIGVSLLSGAHLSLSRKVLKKMEEEGIGDKLFIVGGLIPDEDISELLNMGVAGVFTQSSSLGEIIDFIQRRVTEQRNVEEQRA